MCNDAGYRCSCSGAQSIGAATSTTPIADEENPLCVHLALATMALAALPASVLESEPSVPAAFSISP